MPKIYEWHTEKCEPIEIEIERFEGEGLSKKAITKDGKKLSLGMHRTASIQTLLECQQVVLGARRNALKEELSKAITKLETFNAKWADTIKEGQQTAAELADMFD